MKLKGRGGRSCRKCFNQIIVTRKFFFDFIMQFLHERPFLQDPKLRRKMVSHNYEIAKKFYSYSVLSEKLKNLIFDCTACNQIKNST